uniref:MULE transposase domain-containing protein n=1 Tax=Plectus sambesii TaxID=2011161 RepID=A0A914W3D6_9BILA
MDGSPIVTVADFFAEMSSQFPEGSDQIPSDTVVCADLGCEPENPDALFAFLTTRRLLLNLQKEGGDVLQLDGTYKLMYENNTVLTLGISDRHRQLHPIGIAIIGPTETTTAYVKLFRGLQTALRNLGLPEYQPKAVMSDGDSSITGAIAEVFPGTMRFTCYFHMHKQVKVQMSKKGVPKERRRKVLDEIAALQLSPKSLIYQAAAKKLLKRWKEEGLKKFVRYFRRIWMVGPLHNWFKGALPGSASTNNGLESLHGRIKTHYTLRRRMLIKSFIALCSRMLTDWSRQEVEDRQFESSPPRPKTRHGS